MSKLTAIFRSALYSCLLSALLVTSAAVQPASAAPVRGSALTLEVASKGKASIDRELARRSTEVLKTRLASLGITDGTIEQKGERGITIRLARTGEEVDGILAVLLRPSRLEFRLVDNEATSDQPPAEDEILYEAQMNSATGKIEDVPYVVKRKALLSGDIVEGKDGAGVVLDQFDRPTIQLRLNPRGRELFAKITEASIGKRIAVVIDGNVISAPVVRDVISGGNLQITGAFTLEEAQDLVDAVKTSYLPASIKEVSRHEIAPPEEQTATAEGDVDDLPDSHPKRQPDNFAVVVGIETYRDIKGVDFASRDAASVYLYLTKLMGYPEENIVFLPNERATKSDLEKYLGTWLGNRVTPKSTVLVYYAGHGAPNPQSGEPYLIPYDGDPNYLETTAYPLKTLYARLARLPAKEVVVVLDACFSGAGGRSVIAKGARPLVMTIDTPVALKENMVVLAAAGAHQISTSNEKAGHGLFTYYFLKGLKGEADTAKKGYVTLEDLYTYLVPRVEKSARLMNVEQSPVVMPGLDRLRKNLRIR